MEFTLDPNNRGLSNEILITDLKRVAALLGKTTVTMDDYKKHGRLHPCTCQRRFGSWFKAIEAAGLQRSRVLRITDEELFENLEQVWTGLGRQPRYQEVQKPRSRYSVETYAHRFGSWRKALEAFVAYVNAEGREAPTGHANEESHRTPRQVNGRLHFRVLKRDNFRCKACGRSPATEPGTTLHADHIKAWSKGGETVLENLQTLCEKCNIGKSDT